MLKKIISGGQTGVDRAALDVAMRLGIAHGGWIPKGRKAEKGAKIPPQYDQLKEMATGDYLARTEANVVDSDATLVLTYGKATGGSKKTVEFAKKHEKPVLHIAIDEYSHRDCGIFVRRWFEGDITKPTPPANCTLNVAGSRESKSPDIQREAMNVVIEVINAVNGTCFYPLAGSRPRPSISF